MEKDRCFLLLLEPNEVIFGDYSVSLLNHNDLISEENNDIRGRLKLCSKSLVFDPKDTQLPIIKIRFAEIQKILKDDTSKMKNTLRVKCTQYIEVLENNILAPYKFIRKENEFVFHFHYIQLEDYVLQLCQQLHKASSLTILDQNGMISAIVYSCHNRIKFDPLWLQRHNEEILFDCKVDEIHPLVVNPGRILLTNKFVYFQPYCSITEYPVLKISLDKINAFTKRRYLLRQTGLEIKWQDKKLCTIYISFLNSIDREEFLSVVMKQPILNIKTIEPESMTLKWQNRLISNYDYLLYLNSLADRSFEDLSQYPIFPWIITDYESEELDLNDERIYRDLSKPIGALNPERLERLKERCNEMSDSKYLYGSHYSTPGFVLFYLVRKIPHLMLCLQNGRFDHPDRMFNKVADTFRNCLTNMSDFKELIPEFYDTSQGGDFLFNTKKINFGIRSDGTPVNHVELPPWAKSSPQLFIETLRNALESDYVSANLHHWIDLVFGYKQRGNEAIKADNVFYPLCYEGTVDLDQIKDPAARHALEVQISEFGQIPKQLFSRPHVSRLTSTSLTEIEGPIKTNEERLLTFKLKFLLSYAGHKDEITSLLIDDDNDTIVSTGKDGILKCFQITKKRQIRSIAVSDLAISSCQKISNSNIYVMGSWDNTILLYNCNYGKISNVIPAHDDSVTCLNLLQDSGILISGSSDCTVKVWKGFTNLDYKTFRLSDSMITYLSLDEKITCLTNKYTPTSLIEIVIGTEIGQIFLWDIQIENTKEHGLEIIDVAESRLLLKHDVEITCLELNHNQTKLASCSIDGCLNVTDVSTGMILFSKLQEFPLTNLCWCNDFEYLLTVDTSGLLSVWDLIQGNLKKSKKINNGPLSCITYCKMNHLVIAAGKDNQDYKISCWLLA